MGAIGGLLGVSGGAAGSGFGGPSASPADFTGNANLTNSYNQLQQVAMGNGPNPAMAQYNQNIQNLAKQQAGAISSVQGISPALAARIASQQGSSAMQNAAGQGATTQAEQQLGAMGQAASVAGQQAGIASGMQQNVNNVNAGLAGTSMQGQQGLVGGLMNSVGKVGSLFAGGGEVQKMASGGSAQPMSQFTQFLQGRAAGSPVQVAPTPQTAAVSGFSQGLGGSNKGSGGAPKPSPAASNAGQGPTEAASASMGAGIPYAQPMAAGFAKGGKVPALLSPGETYIPPGKVNQAAKSANPIASGKRVPGKPKVPGNSYANDVVPAKLESGGVVIPNDIMQSKDPAAGARDFIAGIIAKRKARK